jgi:D-threo-aldose 1-dehydrogenase
MDAATTARDLPEVPRVVLGRTGIVSTRFGVGTAVWPLRQPYDKVIEVFQTAFAAGIRHVDTAPLYGSEEIVGRALKDAKPPQDLVLATKACSYSDELGIVYRDYSDRTAYRSVERSLKRLKVDRLSIIHIHDVEPDNLAQIGSKAGALRALLDLKSQGVVQSIGMATVSLACHQWAIDCGDIDHLQMYHTYTLLNTEARQKVIPAAHAKNLTVLNNAPYAGWILQSGPIPNAMYNYYPATPQVIDAVRRLERVCAQKGVTLAEAAVAFSFKSSDVHVTVIGASTPERVRERVKVFASSLTPADFDEMLAAAGGPFPTRASWEGNPINSARSDVL